MTRGGGVRNPLKNRVIVITHTCNNTFFFTFIYMRGKISKKEGSIVKRFLKLGVKTILLATILTVLLTSAIFAAETVGPAPNSGDGESDGSGLESPYGPIGDTGSGSGPLGPAPNSGDGDPDGSGFE
jgi:hypothetical protein